MMNQIFCNKGFSYSNELREVQNNRKIKSITNNKLKQGSRYIEDDVQRQDKNLTGRSRNAL